MYTCTMRTRLFSVVFFFFFFASLQVAFSLETFLIFDLTSPIFPFFASRLASGHETPSITRSFLSLSSFSFVRLVYLRGILMLSPLLLLLVFKGSVFSSLCLPFFPPFFLSCIVLHLSLFFFIGVGTTAAFSFFLFSPRLLFSSPSFCFSSAPDDHLLSAEALPREASGRVSLLLVRGLHPSFQTESF